MNFGRAIGSATVDRGQSVFFAAILGRRIDGPAPRQPDPGGVPAAFRPKGDRLISADEPASVEGFGGMHRTSKRQHHSSGD